MQKYSVGCWAMELTEIKSFIGEKSMSIVDALKIIDANSWGVMYVVFDGKLIGCVSDGDIRRGILKSGNLLMEVSSIMNPNPKYIFEDKRDEAFKLMDEYRITSLPVLNEEHMIIDIILNTMQPKQPDKFSEGMRKHAVVIMAGGKGTRLQPYTKILPKPLIPIGDTPIIERVMKRFKEYGSDKFYISVNYKKRMIESYFSESSTEFDITYIEENIPLGTAGGIGLVKNEFREPFFVTNCDILINADYSNIMSYHIESGNMITVVSSMKNITIPYGVIHTTKDGLIDELSEKPQLSYLINTGMYVINAEAVPFIKENQIYHMTDLIQDLMENGKRVGVYPIGEDSFLDMGEFEEMQRMEKQLKVM